MTAFQYTHQVFMEMDTSGKAGSCSAHVGTCDGAKQKAGAFSGLDTVMGRQVLVWRQMNENSQLHVCLIFAICHQAL